MRLDEILRSVNSDEFQDELYRMGLIDPRFYTVRPDGTVDVHHDMHLARPFKNGKLPLQFGKIDGNWDSEDVGLTTLEGAPTEVTNYFSVARNKITSLNFIPRKIGSHLFLGYNPITSLVGIHEKIDEIHGNLEMSFENIKEGGIGLVMIHGLGELSSCNGLAIPEPFQIINKYVGRPEHLFDCQAELLDNGFDEFAKL